MGFSGKVRRRINQAQPSERKYGDGGENGELMVFRTCCSCCKNSTLPRLGRAALVGGVSGTAGKDLMQRVAVRFPPTTSVKAKQGGTLLTCS